jgi:hypothetical protein
MHEAHHITLKKIRFIPRDIIHKSSIFLHIASLHSDAFAEVMTI